MIVEVACIVEGSGERAAVPLLIRRIAERLDPSLTIRIPQPIRAPKTKLVKPNEIEKAVELAARKVGGKGGVLILLDSDEDCPARTGPDLLRRAASTRGDIPLAVVLAKREFESWFIAAAESIRGKRGLKDSLKSPENPESIQGAKEWIEARMEAGRTYSPVLDQPALVSHLDLEAARRADSFDKCYREVIKMLIRLMEKQREANRG